MLLQPILPKCDSRPVEAQDCFWHAGGQEPWGRGGGRECLLSSARWGHPELGSTWRNQKRHDFCFWDKVLLRSVGWSFLYVTFWRYDYITSPLPGCCASYSLPTLSSSMISQPEEQEMYYRWNIWDKAPQPGLHLLQREVSLRRERWKPHLSVGIRSYPGLEFTIFLSQTPRWLGL